MSTTDKTSVPKDAVRSQLRKAEWASEERRARRSETTKKFWADRRKKFDDRYGSQSVGAYQTVANPRPSFRDWKIDPRSGTIVAHTDYLQPEFLLHRAGGSFVLRESDILAGGKSLAQDCKVPRRDANGFLIEDGPIDLKEAA